LDSIFDLIKRLGHYWKSQSKSNAFLPFIKTIPIKI
jgi:hypothetical protein